jgi:pimeloyl-ACP methyl ester carboxylesterase
MRTALRIVAACLGLVVVLAALALGFRAWRQHENAETYAIRTPNGIQQAMFVRIGGIEQWIRIRGDDRKNPVILYLHGGPGNSESVLYPVFHDWERHFTVVMWDQRGAGKTYGRNGTDEQPMTMAQSVRDGVAMAEYLERHLHKRKIILLGHSWGTEIGLLIVKARPELFSAYVGTGQVVNIAEKETYIYDQTMARMRAAHDEAGIRALDAVGPPPYKSNHDLEIERDWSERYDIPAERDMRWHFTPMVAFAPDFSFRDIYDLLYASNWTAQQLFAQEEKFDARKCCVSFKLPIFIFNGDHDTITPAPLIAPWFKHIEAPEKKFVILTGAGHDAVLLEPDRFLYLLLRNVRPLAVAADAAQPQNSSPVASQNLIHTKATH